jgi:hypothetical protein
MFMERDKGVKCAIFTIKARTPSPQGRIFEEFFRPGLYCRRNASICPFAGDLPRVENAPKKAPLASETEISPAQH